MKWMFNYTNNPNLTNENHKTTDVHRPIYHTRCAKQATVRKVRWMR